MKLDEYRRKRQFGATPEPPGTVRTDPGRAGPLVYVVQKHLASRLHYDFRLEWRGVLLSWAVPKGPSLDPAVKRLAMRTEDHPLEYSSFEGVIPTGQYGAGTVMLWDRGRWEPDSPDVDASLERGEIKFTLGGEKLRGSWVLVRTRGFGATPSQSSWLLVKHRDRYASTSDVTEDAPRSVSSGRLLADIARDDGGDIERASKGDPVGKEPPRISSSGTEARGPSGSSGLFLGDRLDPDLVAFDVVAPADLRERPVAGHLTGVGLVPLREWLPVAAASVERPADRPQRHRWSLARRAHSGGPLKPGARPVGRRSHPRGVR
jgi:DNA ligase D-like protein (predicted 3'-phosphoesterase)